jgi:hypothetical protein
MPNAMTILPSVGEEVLATLVHGVHAALPDNLIGVYLRRSLATGDVIDTSDIDFLVTTERPLSDAARRSNP